MSDDGAQRTYEEAHAAAVAWLEDHWDSELTVRQWWAKLADSGWGMPTWPTEWFGRGIDPQLQPAVREAFGDAGALGPPSSLGQLLGGPTLLTHGTDELKKRFLPPLAKGEEHWCQFFSEPGSGSDLASLQTRAVRDGDEWVVNGQKVWTSGAQLADRGMLVARTNPDVPKHRGITYFVIDLDQPGVEVRPIHQMNGADGFNEVFFNDARVAHDRVVGEVDDGWAVAMTTLAFERFMAGFGVSPGVKAGLLDQQAGEIARGVRQGPGEGVGIYGDPAGLAIKAARLRGNITDPVIRQGLAHLYSLEAISRYSSLRSAAAVRAGHRPGAEGSVRKLARSELARTAREVGLEVLGAEGTLVAPDTILDGALQAIALTSPSASIAGGTDEIQRNIIGERVLGLPREPQVDRDIPWRDLKIGTQRRPES